MIVHKRTCQRNQNIALPAGVVEAWLIDEPRPSGEKKYSRAPRYRRSHHATASALPELPTMGPRGIARKLNLPK
jgi:hypothetical protein